MKRLLPLIALPLCLVACSSNPVKIPEVPAEAALAAVGPTRIPLKPEQEQQIGLVVADVTNRPFRVQVQTSGQVKPAEDRVVHLATPATGRVDRIFVQLGQVVRAGQPVAALKSDVVGQLQTDLLEAILQVESDLKQAQLQATFSRSAFEREQKLFKDRISARADLESARTQYLKDQGAVQALTTKRGAIIQATQERLSLYGVGPGNAERVARSRHIDPFITITTPRGGIISSRTVNIGELTDPSKEMFQVADLSTVWLVSDLYEKDIAQVKLGQTATVSLDSLPGRTFTGRISYLGSALDPQTRTLPVRIIIPNPGLGLRPGMFARAQLQVASRSQLAVPQSALQRNGDFTFAYVPVAPHTYEERRVTVGVADNGYIAITDGLKSGERVATQGTLALKGEALKIVGGLQ